MITKATATYTIQTFIMFLNIVKENQGRVGQEIENYKKSAYSLLAQVSTEEIDPGEASLELNRLIENFNQLLKAPYPTLISDSPETLIKGEIVAFEHYLNQELKAHHLTLQQQAPLFNDSLKLWEKVGVSLTIKEGVSEFSALVQKLNHFLPPQEHYPLPDPDQWSI